MSNSSRMRQCVACSVKGSENLFRCHYRVTEKTRDRYKKIFGEQIELGDLCNRCYHSAWLIFRGRKKSSTEGSDAERESRPANTVAIRGKKKKRGRPSKWEPVSSSYTTQPSGGDLFEEPTKRSKRKPCLPTCSIDTSTSLDYLIDSTSYGLIWSPNRSTHQPKRPGRPRGRPGRPRGRPGRPRGRSGRSRGRGRGVLSVPSEVSVGDNNADMSDGGDNGDKSVLKKCSNPGCRTVGKTPMWRYVFCRGNRVMLCNACGLRCRHGSMCDSCCYVIDGDADAEDKEVSVCVDCRKRFHRKCAVIFAKSRETLFNEERCMDCLELIGSSEEEFEEKEEEDGDLEELSIDEDD